MAVDEQQKQTRIPGFEGHDVDVVVVKFSGQVSLNRHDPDDAQLFRGLRLGKRVQMSVEGVVSQRAFDRKENRDTESTDTRSQATVRVDSIVEG